MSVEVRSPLRKGARILHYTVVRRRNRSGVHEPLAASVAVTDDEVAIQLVDGRTLAVPMAWYPRRLHGTAAERAHWQLTGRGIGIHWPTLDEDISVEQVLADVPSGESAASLRRWHEGRRGAA